MSRGQRARTRVNFPRMKVRGARRREAQASAEAFRRIIAAVGGLARGFMSVGAAAVHARIGFHQMAVFEASMAQLQAAAYPRYEPEFDFGASSAREAAVQLLAERSSERSSWHMPLMACDLKGARRG